VSPSHIQRVRERAYVIWEEEGRYHGNDLSHWFCAELEIPLRVTFDSNAYRQVIDPALDRDASTLELQKINRSLKVGGVRGYLSDTIVTLESIKNKDRTAVLAGTNLTFQSQPGKHTAPSVISIDMTIGMRQSRKPLHPTTLKWIEAAKALGMRFMRTGSRWFSGAGHVRDDDDTTYEPEESILALAQRMEKVNKAAEAIQARGVGYAAAVFLGKQFSTPGELWLQGLGRVSKEEEVQNVVKEWADGDSIAAHIGYANDLFCSRDQGKGTKGKPSILDKDNRAWITSTYGVQFVTLPELARML
jgi:Protein of unknown function (DUF2934)